MDRYKIVKINSLLFGLIIFFFTNQAASQFKNYAGARYPEGFEIQAEHSNTSPAKSVYDTMHYEVLRKIKEDFVVNSGCGQYGTDQHQINIACDTRGDFLCAWNDDRAGDRQVNAQRYDSSGNRVGPLIHVSEGNANWNSEPHITFNKKNNEYIVVWAGLGYDIRFQRITASGLKIGNNLTANQLWATNTNNPSAATDSSGNIIITWMADTECCLDGMPYCRIFNEEGIPITDQWALVPSGNANVSSYGWDDRIASDSIGRCIIVWSSHINGRSRIVFQSVNQTGNLYAQPIIVSDPQDSTTHYFPTVASTSDGHFLFLWSSQEGGLFGRIYHPDNGFVTPQFAISDQTSYWTMYCASSNEKDKFYLIWVSDRPYARIISTNGQTSGPPIPLTFSSSISWVYYPRLPRIISGRVTMAYGGYYRTQTDVMLQAFDTSFNPIGSSIKAANDDCSAWQTNPIVQYNQFGKSLVVWEDQRNGNHELYGQVLDESGTPVSSNFLLSNPDTIKWVSKPSIVPDNEGNFVVAFGGGEYSTRNLLLQKVSASGELIGSNKWITNNIYYDYGQLTNVIKKSDAGDILLCWYSGVHSSVYSQRVSQELTPRRASLPIFNTYPSAGKKILGLSTNGQFNVLVMWVDYDLLTYQEGKTVKAAVLNEQGKIVRDTFVVAVIADYRSINGSSCLINENNDMIFAWSDNSRLDVKRFYIQDNVSNVDSFSTDSDGQIQIIKFENKKAFVAWTYYTQVKSLFLDDNYSAFVPVQLHVFESPVSTREGTNNSYHADIFEDKLLSGYEGLKSPDEGFNIYANLQQIDQFDFHPVAPLKNEFIASVYPNPSARHATLQYEIAAQTNVSISVYNVLGQKIADIDTGIKSPGRYTLQFPIKGLATGMYFFHYRGIKSYMKKFIVIK